MLEQNLQNICYNKYSGSSQIDLPLIKKKKNINLVRLIYIVPIIIYIDTGIKVYSLLGKE